MREMPVRLTKLHRAIISRATLGVVAAGLLYGGANCLLLTKAFSEQAPVRAGRSSGAGLPLLIGIVLLVLGIVFALAALTPSSVFGRIMGPPSNTTLHDNPEPPGRWWSWWG